MDPDASAQHPAPPCRTPRARACVRSSPVAQSLLHSPGPVFLDGCPCCCPSVLDQVTSRLESRMRETRQSGSEGGGGESNRFSLPLFLNAFAPDLLSFC